MNVYIKEIRLKNFQSWKNGVLHLTPGFNVIRSDDNSAGKSVVMKAIKIAVCPTIFGRVQRKKLIRRGADYAEAIFIFSDNTLGAVRVFPTKLLYMYNNGNGWQQTDGFPTEEFVEKMGALVKNDYDFIANMLDMDLPLLLVKSDNKCNFALIDLITHHKDLNRLIPIFRDKLHDNRDKFIKLDFAVNYLERQYKDLTFIDVDRKEENLKVAEDLLCYLDEFIYGLSLLESMESLNNNYKDFETIDFLLDTGSKFIDLVNINITPVKELPADIDTIVDLVCVGQNLVNSIELNKDYTYLTDVENILNVGEKFIEAEDILEDILNDINKEVSKYRLEFIEAFNKLNLAKTQLTELQNRDLEIANMEVYLNEIGAEENCPIYGKVKIKGDKCFYINNV